MTQVADATWDEVERRIRAGALALLPVGAGAKQHGRHLPMAADRIQAEWLAGEIAGARDVLVWPTLTLGHYPAFVDYPGSLSLSAQTFEALVWETAAAILGFGVRGLVVLDTGFSTIAPIERALGRLGADRVRCLHARVYDGPGVRAAAAQAFGPAPLGHADAIETSILLAIAPAVVAMARAEPASPPGPGPLQRRDPSAPNFSASGVIGDPRTATPEAGAVLLAAMKADALDAVDRFRAGLTAGDSQRQP